MFSLQIFVIFQLSYSPFVVSCAITIRKMLNTISSLLNLLRFVLWSNIWFILENVTCVLVKNVYSAALHLDGILLLKMVQRLRPVVSYQQKFLWFSRISGPTRTWWIPNLYQNYNPAWFLCTMKLGKCWSGSSFLILLGNNWTA